MWRALPERITELEQNPEIRVIVIRGAGERAFGAGADISEFEEHRKDPQSAAEYAESNERAFLSIRECSKPTIAMIHGFCIGGGCAVALCADIRVASRDAKFAITPARLGLGYSFSGVEHVVQELGPAGARYLFLTAAQIAAERAMELGVIQEVYEIEELEVGTGKLARQIAENAPFTLRALKESIRQPGRSAGERDLGAVEEMIRACFSSHDYQEGLRAFAEKRKPVFRDR